ncbi:hypothetical protein E0L36_21990 [Streptomyces sp. AJS327]|uniref:hypothetical protein n=1 Tax=Streptomyces sp. AJS327 TaxID=2545265 RepID=UPI0015DEA8D9|nr:hypothetical protein [Streptomyces sp. AJS327]MBA0053448.1 hypothetical protein [Streptomyces sp. AJS327]
MDDWKPRPIRMPDEHLPNSAREIWNCRACLTPWPCDTTRGYLTPGRCQCGSATWWEERGPRNWHLGPRCYTEQDRMDALARELRQIHNAHPHFPPSHYYPPKPRRPVRQRPPYTHTPRRSGDIAPGTWLWVKPGGLHPGWGDLHHLAMLTAVGTPTCEVWLHLDGTVHQVRADLLILELTARRAGVEVTRNRALPDAYRWLRWTVAQHLDHRAPARPEPPVAEQEALFAA